MLLAQGWNKATNFFPAEGFKLPQHWEVGQFAVKVACALGAMRSAADRSLHSASGISPSVLQLEQMLDPIPGCVNAQQHVSRQPSQGEQQHLKCAIIVQGSAESGLVRPRGSSPDTRSAAANLLSLFGRRSSGNLRTESPTLKRSASGTQPMCLICLENLTADDFQVCSTPFC